MISAKHIFQGYLSVISGRCPEKIVFAGLFILQVYSCRLREIYYFNLLLPCFPRQREEFLWSLEIEQNNKEIGKTRM